MFDDRDTQVESGGSFILAAELAMFCAVAVIGFMDGDPWAAAISGVAVSVFLA